MIKLQKTISLLIVLLTTIYLMTFYIRHPEILLMPKYMILIKYGVFGVLIPVICYIIAGIIFWIADSKSNNDSWC